MRILIMALGIASEGVGIFCMANAGMSFISLAFPVGLLLVIVGVAECFTYKITNDDEEDRHWMVIEGQSTFVLGILVLSGRLVSDAAVPVVFGLWILISGIRGFVVVMSNLNKNEKKDLSFFWGIVVNTCSVVMGLYTFYNVSLLMISVLMMLGIILVIQGADIVKLGMDMPKRKPELIKTKEEKVEEAEEAAAKAKRKAKKAIKEAKKARKAASEAAKAKEFEEIISEPIEGEKIVEEPEEENLEDLPRSSKKLITKSEAKTKEKAEN